MTRKNQFWKGMLLGAIAGGAISLLDKQTRQAMKENVQKAANIVKHPGEMTDMVKGTVAKLRTTMEQVSEDISFIVDKVDELRELTPQVSDMIKETKDTFTKSDEDDEQTI
jgi:gas vesicle protein